MGTTASLLDENKVLDVDTTISLETTWRAMEQLVSMGLVRSIGIRYHTHIYVHTDTCRMVIYIDTHIYRYMYIYSCMGMAHINACSNYDVFLTRDCLAYSKIKPAVNQFETHPYFQRDSLIKFCAKHGICVTAHTPLGGSVANTQLFGSVSCLDDPLLKVNIY